VGVEPVVGTIARSMRRKGEWRWEGLVKRDLERCWRLKRGCVGRGPYRSEKPAVS